MSDRLEAPMFKVWVRDELDVQGQILTDSATLADVEAICRSMNNQGVTGYEDADASWWWLLDDGRAGLEIVLSEATP